MRLIILLSFFLIYALTDGSCNSKAQGGNSPQVPGTETDSTTVGIETQTLPYEILMSGCKDNKKCVVIAYCDPKMFNEGDMEKLLTELSAKFRKNHVVNANLFDERDIAHSYAKGRRNLGDLQHERRGWYLKTKDTEFLLFYPDAERKNAPISIKPRTDKP